METRTTKIVAAFGVVGSLASVAALFVSNGGGSGGPAPAPSNSPAQPQVQSAAPQLQSPAVQPDPDAPRPLRLPPISELLFSEARELLLRLGWFPMNSAINPTGNPNLLSGNGPYFVELGYRELINCSGTGLGACKFAYRSEAGQYLYVITVGEENMARVNDLWITDEPEEQ